MPGGIDSHVSSLFTTTVSRQASPGGRLRSRRPRRACIPLRARGRRCRRSRPWPGGSRRRSGGRPAARPSREERRPRAGTRRRRRDRGLRVDQDVVEAARHRHLRASRRGPRHQPCVATRPRRRRRRSPRCRRAAWSRVSRVLWSKHGVSRSVVQPSAGSSASSSTHDVGDRIGARRPCRWCRGHLAVEVRPLLGHRVERLGGTVPQQRTVVAGRTRPASVAGSVRSQTTKWPASAARTPGSSTTPPGAASTDGVVAGQDRSTAPTRAAGRPPRRPPPTARGRSCPFPGDDDVDVDERPDLSRAATSAPTVDFPDPIRPTSTTCLTRRPRRRRQARLKARSAAVSTASSSSRRCSATRPAR